MLRGVYKHLRSHPKLAVNGFCACGMRPFDRHAVDDKIISRESRPPVLQKAISVFDEEHLADMREFYKDFVKMTLMTH